MKSHLAGTLSRQSRVLLILLPFVAAFAALCIGRYSFISPAQFLASAKEFILGLKPQDGNTYTVLWSIRFPRILTALLVGAGLSAAGCAFQGLFSNPLATPDTLGVASGASFGAVLGLLFGFDLIGVQLLAILMGFAAIVLTYVTGAGREFRMNTVVLAGIMIGSLFNALVSLVKYVADAESQLPAITYWLMGSLASTGYRSLAMCAPVIIVGLIILFALRWRLNLLPLTEDEARATGTNIMALRLVTAVCAAAITAACISLCGQVGWVGLLIPHICRMKYGNNNMSIIPASISLGAVFMVVVDTAARTLSAAEIPVSILTAIIGAPFFIALMRKSGGWRL
ncbi:MAG: iron ABC transporter permease [Oscillospiraceae bacterium]|nr:iron ABC transporter permease [Oscillospiraceae bacterium]